MCGASGYTTAKVTSLHGLIYNYLARHHRAERAGAYAAANQAALEHIAQLVADNSIDCDWVARRLHVCHYCRPGRSDRD